MSTFIQVPPNVSDPITLTRFLTSLIAYIDVAYGNRGEEQFITTSSFGNGIASLQELIDAVTHELEDYSKLDGSRAYSGIVKYNSDKTFTDDKELIAKKYADDTFELIGTNTNNPQQAAISDLNQTISDPPTQVEVQAISDKVDELLSSLRLSNLI